MRYHSHVVDHWLPYCVPPRSHVVVPCLASQPAGDFLSTLLFFFGVPAPKGSHVGYRPSFRLHFWEPPAGPRLFALHLRTATAPHKNLQPATLRRAPDGVCSSKVRQTVVGCQKHPTRCFWELEVASQMHKKLAKSLNISFHAREP